MRPHPLDALAPNAVIDHFDELVPRAVILLRGARSVAPPPAPDLPYFDRSALNEGP